MNKRNIIGIICFSIVAAFLVFTGFMMHSFGNPDETSMDDNIIVSAQDETGANNAVTSVVFDYRGFDTLGEATVLFTAVAGVIMVLRRMKK